MRGARDMTSTKAKDITECTDKCRSGQFMTSDLPHLTSHTSFLIQFLFSFIRDERGQLSFECRSFLWTEVTGECVLYEVDIYSSGVVLVTSPASDLYQLVCVTAGDIDTDNQLR